VIKESATHGFGLSALGPASLGLLLAPRAWNRELPSFYEPNILEPPRAEARPGADGRVALGQAEPVFAVREGMDRERHARLAERQREDQAVLDRHARVVGRMPDERRRVPGRDAVLQ